ncbi:MAG: carbamoyltransferase C-terminal domain-containing protein [Myxococcota bacterium]
MITLGIADNHDSGAALVVDGQLVAAINQERIDRIKGSSAFPWGAIDAVLSEAKVSARQVDHIVVGTAFTPSALLRLLPQQHQTAKSTGQFSSALHGYMVYQSLLQKLGAHAIEYSLCHRILNRKLRARPFEHAQLHLMDHHQAHAEAAYRTQARDRILVLTLDAMGDGRSATAWLGDNGQLTPLWSQSGLAAINLFYSRITEIIGFKPLRHEGKITGLAAYATPPDELMAQFRSQLKYENGRFKRMPIFTPAKANDRFWNALTSYSKEEIASAAQAILEEVTLDYVRYWLKRTQTTHLAVAGGVFANVKLNQRIAELSELESLWVLPHMGDGGLAAGGALGFQKSAPKQMNTAYLGPSYPENDAFRALKRIKVERNKQDSLLRAAQCLAEGGVIARCKGRMEWGPRALGNRTIFATPNDPEINNRLNARLQRTEFMPFAPIVREEDATRYFIGLEKANEAARFMTVCFNVTPEFQKNCPAAVHVDGTARPQVLRREDNPEVHTLLGMVGELTGTPVLINTSFNMHEEPIVCTADEGVKAWNQAGLEGLLIGAYFAEPTKN